MSVSALSGQRNISTDLLRTFVTLVKTGSFTRTGETLKLSQPTVSVHLKKLQEQIGADLLDKTAPGVKLTAYGEVVLAYANDMLSINDELIGRIEDGRLLGSEIRIGIPCEVRATISTLLAEFRESNGGVNFDIAHNYSEELYDRFRRGTLDICATLTAHEPGVDRLYRWREILQWGAAPGFPIPVVEPIPIVAAPIGSACRDATLEALRKANKRYEIVVSVDRVSESIDAVRAGLGVMALLPSNISADMRMLGPESGLPSIDKPYHWGIFIHPDSRSATTERLALSIARRLAPHGAAFES